MKSWSYRKITLEAERRIRSLVEGRSPEDERLYRQWAYGVHLGWNSLTMGWQQDDDGERLEALALGKSA